MYPNLWMKSGQMVRTAIITANAQVATLLGSIPMIWLNNDVHRIRVEYRISDILLAFCYNFLFLAAQLKGTQA